MPQINIDELCEPIEIIVGGGTYTVDDISRDTAKKMMEISAGEDDSNNVDAMAVIMADVLGADEADIAKLGMRKLIKLITAVMSTITDEVEGKNVPKADPVK